MRPFFEKISPAAGQSFYLKEWRGERFEAPWHFHPEFELTLIVAGRGRRFVGDSIEPFEAGDLVLLGGNLPHFWHSEPPARKAGPSESHSVVWLFNARLLGADWRTQPEFIPIKRLLERAQRGVRFSGGALPPIAKRFQRVPRQRGLPALLELLAILNALADPGLGRPLASAAYIPNLNPRAEQRMARVYGFLMRRFAEPLTLPQIARVAAMTPAAFSRYFKRATGRNVSVFLTDLRVDQAARLLQERGRSIAEIASISGFGCLSNFNRRFRERTRQTPREYRQLAQVTVPAFDSARFQPLNPTGHFADPG